MDEANPEPAAPEVPPENVVAGRTWVYVGEVERVFPFIQLPDGHTLVCQPGQSYALDVDPDNPLLQPADPA